LVTPRGGILAVAAAIAADAAHWPVAEDLLDRWQALGRPLLTLPRGRLVVDLGTWLRTARTRQELVDLDASLHRAEEAAQARARHACGRWPCAFDGDCAVWVQRWKANGAPTLVVAPGMQVLDFDRWVHQPLPPPDEQPLQAVRERVRALPRGDLISDAMLSSRVGDAGDQDAPPDSQQSGP
jgi:hypothetical protein